MDADVSELIQQIHAAPRKAALVATEAAPARPPGCWPSRRLRAPCWKRRFPMRSRLWRNTWGANPDSYCSAPTARGPGLYARERRTLTVR